MTYSKSDIEKEYLKGKTKRYSESKNESIKQFINNQISLAISHKEKVYCFIHDISPKCKVCDNIPSFENFVSGYKETCSVSCSVKLNKHIQEKTRIHNIQQTVSNLSIEEIVDGIYHKKNKNTKMARN